LLEEGRFARDLVIDEVFEDLEPAVPGTFFVHWPEEQLHPTRAMEKLLWRINAYRAEQGLDPYYRPLRGAGNAAFLTLLEGANVPDGRQLYAHSSTRFRLGYYEPSLRTWACLGDCEGWQGPLTIEIIVGVGDLTLSEDARVDRYFDLWKNSPDHDAALRWDYSDGEFDRAPMAMQLYELRMPAISQHYRHWYSDDAYEVSHNPPVPMDVCCAVMHDYGRAFLPLSTLVWDTPDGKVG
jgi:hypothetical protein